MVDGNDPVKLSESHERPWLNSARELPGVFPMKDFGGFLAGEVFNHLRGTLPDLITISRRNVDREIFRG